MSNWFEPNIENEQTQTTPDAPDELEEDSNIEEVIEEHTGDGPGDIDLDNPPESDFVSFSEPDVEKEDDE